MVLSLIQDFLYAPEPPADVQARAFLKFIALLWAVHMINWGIFRGSLNRAFGVRPRSVLGLPGIIMSPFLHSVRGEHMRVKGDLQFLYMNYHLCGNTIGLLTYGGFILIVGGINLFYIVTILTALASGIGTWIFGRENTNHVGFSGVTYGYSGFLLIFSFLSASILGTVLSVFFGFLRYRIMSAITPAARPGISWEGHFFGFLGGAVAAYVVKYIQVG